MRSALNSSDDISALERNLIDAAIRWYRWSRENGCTADDFDGQSRDEWLACKALVEALRKVERA